MSSWTLLSILAVVAAIGLVGIAAVGVSAGRQGIARAHAALGELAVSRGWRFAEVRTMDVMYEIQGPGWVVRARRMSGAGPRVESGLHTRFSAPGAGGPLLYVGPTPPDPAAEVERLLGAPASVTPLSAGGLPDGYAAYGAGDAIAEHVVAALAKLPVERRWEALMHPGGVDVWFKGTVSDPAAIEALIAAGEGIANSR